MCRRHERLSLRLGRGVSRREVLRLSLAGTGLVALGPLVGKIPVVSGAPLSLKRLVVLNLIGGNDSLNTTIPVNLAPYYSRRPTIAIPAAQALSLAGGPGTNEIKLHPALDGIQALWNEGSVALVHRVGYPTANLSHFSSEDIWSYGVRGSFSPLGIDPSGWIARYASEYAPTPMGAVSVGVGRRLDFEGGTSNPLTLSRVANFAFTSDPAYPSDHVHRVDTIQSILAGFSTTGLPGEARQAVSDAFDLSAQVQAALASYTSGVTYSSQTISQLMRDVAILVQGGFSTRVFYTGFGGFDTHSAQGAAAGAQATLLGRLDDAVTSFASDMKAMGQWGNTVIAVISEFGRRNYENGSFGSDHGHGQTILLVGGAVKGGIHGPDLVDADLNAEYPDYAVDFRDVFREIVQEHLGANPAPVFPESQPLANPVDVV
jgi:uncharacterized protein (DUF1501 family)